MIALLLAAALWWSVESTLDESLENGIFRLKMRSDAPVEVMYQLLDKDGSAVADALYRFSGEVDTVPDVIPGVRRWTAETPELYTLLLRVDGEYTRYAVGFRRLELKGNQFLVNGKPVKFKSVNYHGHNPDSGRYQTRRNILEDLRLMKQANINTIYTGHYPQSRELCQLCDSLGFYVFDGADGKFSYNDIVGPDRRPYPAFWEVKHQYQYIAVRRSGDGFEVFNRKYFTPLDCKMRWWVERDGRRIRRGKVRLWAAPQDVQPLSLRLPRMKKPGEYRLFFETPLSCDEFLLATVPGKPAKAIPSQGEAVNGDTRLVLRNRKAELVFDKVSGVIVSYSVRGKDMVQERFGIRTGFWSAPTDNDRVNGLPQRAAAWKDAVKKVRTDVRGGVISALYTLPGGASMRAEYALLENGALHVSVAFKGGSGAIELPCLGYSFRVPEDQFTYFGRGPVANYRDRLCGTFRSVWECTQESGHHTETSWLRIGGMKVQAGASGPFEFNALRRSVEDLDQGLMPERDFTEVCIDYGITGVGDYSWDFTITPVRKAWPFRRKRV